MGNRNCRIGGYSGICFAVVSVWQEHRGDDAGEIVGNLLSG